MFPDKSVVIVGGGLSGLTSAILLKRAGFNVTLIEKKIYPFHRVCGEYVSNEVLPFLSSLGLDILALNPSNITQLAVSSPSGKLFKTQLDLGGFGLSRYTFDNLLYKKAKAEGVHCMNGSKVITINYQSDYFKIHLDDNTKLETAYVIATYGKRANLDKTREFFYNRSPYLGVKYHVRTDLDSNLIQLDNFEGGYCGTVKIENDCYNLCYLIENKHLKRYGSIQQMEKQILFKNPILKERFSSADLIINKPEVINEISFQKKTLVENHILYCGDAAGMITPLCGNGMAMAIHSARILSDAIIEFYENRETVEKFYQHKWKNHFENRLKMGRTIQKIINHKVASEIAIRSFNIFPELSRHIIKRTHGKPF